MKCIPSEVVTVAYVKGRHVRQEPLSYPSPQYVPHYTNVETHNSFPVSASSSLWRHDSDIQTDNPIHMMTSPSYMDFTSSQNTYRPYRYGSTQSTYPKSTIDNHPLSDIGACLVGCSFLICYICFCLIIQVPFWPVICCCSVIIGCFGSSDSERIRSNSLRSRY